MAEDTQQNKPQTDQETEDSTQAAQDEPQLDVAIEDAGTLRKKVTVTIPRARIDAKMDEMFGELSSSAQVPGFRIGHAPRKLIEKRFGKEVSGDVKNSLVGESLGQAIDKADLKTLGEPEIKLDEIELPDEGDMEYSFDVEVQPEFELPALEGIEVEKPKVEITEQRIDEGIDSVRENFTRFEQTDGPVSQGDVLKVDVQLTGQDVSAAHRRDVTLRAAPGQVEGIPLVELPEQLSGKKVGDVVEITATAPQSHPNEDWRGKELKIELTIKEIQRRVLPEVNDEFASSCGFDSVDDMRRQVRRRMEANVQNETQRRMRQQVCQYLLDNTDFELPQGVVDRHTQRVLQRRYVDLLYQGVPRERIDENLTQLRATAGQEAQRDLKLTFILQKVAQAQGVEVDDGEVNSRVAQMASQYNRRPQRLREELERDGTIDSVRSTLREEKALDKLLEQARVKEVSQEEQADKTKPDQEKKKSASAGGKKKTRRKKSKTSGGRKSSGKKSAKKKTSGRKSKSAGKKSK